MAAVVLLLAPVLSRAEPSPAPAPDAASSTPKKAAKKKKSGRHAAKAHPLKIPNSQHEPLAWHEISGWMDDDHAEAYATFLSSCRPILKSSEKARSERGPAYRALFEVCGRAVAALPLDAAGARAFFEQNFRPVRLTAAGENEGFFTGYYEPVVEGSRFPSDTYTTPLYRRPSDLVMQRIRRSAKKGKAGKRAVKRVSAPYFDRAQIEDGALAGRDLEICWLKGPIDAFFAEIQGSVRVRLEDGQVIRLNYAAGNGHPYFAVGSVLIQRGIVPKEEMSMQKIREYMEKFPEEGKELRRMNRSYVFFRETDLSEFDEAIGAQGISLTAARSIAVDRKLHTYGMPVFVNALLPIVSEKPDTWFRRLMVAQDTGGAIVGPARADIYLGAGTEAERAAGRFKHSGQFVMLIPNELDPDGEADGTGLPRPRPVEAGPALLAEMKPGHAPTLAAATAKPQPQSKPAQPKHATAESKADGPPMPRPKPARAATAKLDPAPKPATGPAAKPAMKPAMKPAAPSLVRPAAAAPKPAAPTADASAPAPAAKPAQSAPQPAAKPAPAQLRL
jgi:membrane-bound lytic murein transglycosylase A